MASSSKFVAPRALLIAVALLGVLGALRYRSSSLARAPLQAIAPGPSPARSTDRPTAPPAPSHSRPPAVPSVSAVASSSVSEESLFTMRLRALEGSEPAAALALAREGDIRFPNGADAAERAAIAVQSLGRLGRFAEARGEARALARRYPGTPSAARVAVLAEAPPGSP